MDIGLQGLQNVIDDPIVDLGNQVVHAGGLFEL